MLTTCRCLKEERKREREIERETLNELRKRRKKEGNMAKERKCSDVEEKCS
jgi:hypothetical protein